MFTEPMNHSMFSDYNPVSAGFISMGVKDGEFYCECYGESVTLKLKSDPEKDTKLANFQFFNPYV
jgi:hypothetical protein